MKSYTDYYKVLMLELDCSVDIVLIDNCVDVDGLK